VVAISGREGAGMHNFIKALVKMSEAVHPGSSEVYIVDGIQRKLAALKNETNVKSYEIVQENAINLIKDIASELKRRYDAVASGDENALANASTIVLILNSYDATEAISNNPVALASYKEITGKYKNMNVCVILGDFENANVPYAAPEIYKKARDAKHFMFFDDLANIKVLDMPLAVLRQFKKPIEIGDGYYIKDNNCKKIKTVRSN
jgi:S-DNA-T family DNA segregation ATPase FtsK/SpoIIIE